MGKRALGARGPVALAVIVIVGLSLWRLVPFLTQEREVVASTPSPPPVWVPTGLTLTGGSRACLDQVPFDQHSQVARLVVSDGPKSGPPLGLTMRAPGFSGSATIPGGYPHGTVQVDVPSPRHSTIGTVCVRNEGSKKILLQGSTEGRTVSRPNVQVDGQPVAIKVSFTFLEKHPASLISRVPQIFEHASTFKPMPVWLLWPLALLVVVGLPAGVLMAFAGAVRGGTLVAPNPVPTAPRVPLPGFRAALVKGWRRGLEHAERIPSGWALGVGLVVLAGYMFSFALRTHTFQLDENQYVYFARFTWEHFPDALWNTTVINRGIQRLEAWLLILPLGLFSSPTSFVIGHVLNVAAYASTGVPVYLMARGLGLRGGWSLAAVVLSTVVPWAVVVTSFLTEPIAYPAFVWALWAIWRACVRPGPRADALALALIVIAALARANLLVLFPLLYGCVLFHELRFGARSPRLLLRRHWPLPAFVGLGVFLLLLSKAGVLPPTQSLTGYYGTSLQGISAAFLEKNWVYVARLTAGTGLVGAAIGTAWLWRQVIRPADAPRHAFALVALGSVLLVLYSNATGGTDERYIIYLAAPLMLAAVAGLARRDVAWPLVAVAGVLGAVVMHHVGWNSQGGPFGFFIGPAETFYARVGLLNLQTWRPGHDPRTVAFVIALGVAAICALAMMRGQGFARLRTALVVALILFEVVQTQYTLSHFVNEAASASGPGLGAHAWVDKAAYDKRPVGIWAVGEGNTGDYNAVWMDVQFWNNAVQSEVGMDGPVLVQNPPGDDLIYTRADPTTGRLSLTAPPPPQRPRPLPKLLVVPATGREAILGTPVTQSSFLPARLLRVAQPPRLRWGFTGADPDGYVHSDPARIRVFRAALPAGAAQCLVVDVRTPFGWKGRYQIAAAGFHKRAAIGSDALARVYVPLNRISGAGGRAPYQEVTLAGLGKPVALGDGRTGTVRIGALSTGRCQ